MVKTAVGASLLRIPDAKVLVDRSPESVDEVEAAERLPVIVDIKVLVTDCVTVGNAGASLLGATILDKLRFSVEEPSVVAELSEDGVGTALEKEVNVAFV